MALWLCTSSQKCNMFYRKDIQYTGYVTNFLFWRRNPDALSLICKERHAHCCECTSNSGMEEKEVLNKVVIFVFFAHKNLLWSFIKLRLCWKLCSSKVENSEEKTRRLRIRSSAEFLYSMTCVVICSHRRSHLSHFYRVSYRSFWRRDS